MELGEITNDDHQLSATDADAVPVLRSHLATVLELPPSCIGFSPADPQFFVVGTYLLVSESDTSPTTQVQDVDNSGRRVQVRSGSLILFYLKGDLL